MHCFLTTPPRTTSMVVHLVHPFEHLDLCNTWIRVQASPIDSQAKLRLVLC